MTIRNKVFNFCIICTNKIEEVYWQMIWVSVFIPFHVVVYSLFLALLGLGKTGTLFC